MHAEIAHWPYGSPELTIFGVGERKSANAHLKNPCQKGDKRIIRARQL